MLLLIIILQDKKYVTHHMHTQTLTAVVYITDDLDWCYCVWQIIAFVKERMTKTNMQDHEIVVLVTDNFHYLTMTFS